MFLSIYFFQQAVKNKEIIYFQIDPNQRTEIDVENLKKLCIPIISQMNAYSAVYYGNITENTQGSVDMMNVTGLTTLLNCHFNYSNHRTDFHHQGDSWGFYAGIFF